jgi:CubicO group peptidase (beta-lactamase class C family)
MLDAGCWMLDTGCWGDHYPASNIQYPVSSIQHPASSIQHPASSIQHPASSIQHLFSVETKMRVSTMTLSLLLTTFIALQSNAQSTTQSGRADSASIDSKVDAVFANYNTPDSPGCALGVIKDGKIVYARGYGMANLEHNIPNGPKIVYDIGSTSKQFTAASILLLAQAGKLSLDDDVRKLTPELKTPPVMVRQLIHHTSGLRDYLTLFSLAGVNFDDTTTEEDALKIITRQKGLNFVPGSEWLYSNSGYFLLSIIVKRASGKSLSDYAKENIFEPLGMRNTLYLDDHKRIVPMRATGYSPSPKGGFQIEMSNFEQTGDGAVLTSIEDLLLWDRNFYEAKVGGRDFIGRMQETGSLNNGEKLDYAAGLFVNEYRGLKRVSHGGSWAGFRSDLIRFPNQKFSVACLCNLASANPTQLALKVADIYLADQFKAGESNPDSSAKPQAVALSETELKAKAGVYRSPKTGGLRRISLRDGKLRIDSFTAGSFELTPVSASRFVALAPGQTNEIEFDSGRFTLKRAGQAAEVFEAVEAFTPAISQLVEYAGAYYSEELDANYTVSLDGDKLIFFGKSGPKRPMQPAFRDGFVSLSGVQLEFNRDAQGKIAGFGVNAGRIRNVRFVRLAK